ncbi:hypothetical protein MKK50_00235 [Methylobacterium sp. J-043]|nr:hypothetical protein [Methylobacterium sp. J-043]
MASTLSVDLRERVVAAVAAGSSVSKTILSAPAPPLTVKDGAGGRLARWSVSSPLPRITPRLVVGAAKARLPQGAAWEPPVGASG